MENFALNFKIETVEYGYNSVTYLVTKTNDKIDWPPKNELIETISTYPFGGSVKKLDSKTCLVKTFID